MLDTHLTDRSRGMHEHKHRWYLAISSALAAAVLASCGGGNGHDVATASSSRTPGDDASTQSGLIDIGAGRHLFLTCRGTGSPTILLDAGGGDDSSAWSPEITDALQARTRTCAYDRAGTGSSDPAPDRRRMMVDVVGDLDALLARSGITDKLLLVGSSFGGQVVLDYALHHADRVVGLVILDTDWPTGDVARSPARVLTPAERHEIKVADAWDAPDNREHIAYQETLPETEAAFHTLPGIPIRILSAGLSSDCADSAAACARVLRTTIELQAQWLRLSPTATRRVVHASHDMHEEVPDLVRDEILAVLART
jgi:pimeloyl-ACP methyl ester carboxylesterase